jgi:crotonobetainyl-CoA:carnitine CoA-transferase CaiB-like acyl-CoA transferase
MVANPIKLSATPPSYERAPPMVGQHTAEVLRELAGVERDELERLRGLGIV